MPHDAALFLLFTSTFPALGHALLLPQLVGVLIVLPVFLLVAGVVRLGWSLRAGCGAPWRDVPPAAMIMFALTFTVARACVGGLVISGGRQRPPAGSGRGPKSKSEHPDCTFVISFAADRQEDTAVVHWSRQTFAVNRSVAGCNIKADGGADGTCHSVASCAVADSPTISLTDAARLTRSTWFAKSLVRLW